jgi:hypothetical protein
LPAALASYACLPRWPPRWSPHWPAALISSKYVCPNPLLRAVLWCCFHAERNTTLHGTLAGGPVSSRRALRRVCEPTGPRGRRSFAPAHTLVRKRSLSAAVHYGSKSGFQRHTQPFRLAALDPASLARRCDAATQNLLETPRLAGSQSSRQTSYNSVERGDRHVAGFCARGDRHRPPAQPTAWWAANLWTMVPAG